VLALQCDLDVLLLLVRVVQRVGDRLGAQPIDLLLAAGFLDDALGRKEAALLVVIDRSIEERDQARLQTDDLGAILPAVPLRLTETEEGGPGEAIALTRLLADAEAKLLVVGDDGDEDGRRGKAVRRQVGRVAVQRDSREA